MSNDSSVVTTISARALASRKNGARSRGPKTAAGKARSSRNALKHGLCAQKVLVLAEEDAAAFCTLETALFEELAPAGPLQTVLAQRVVSAAWRLLRADRAACAPSRRSRPRRAPPVCPRRRPHAAAPDICPQPETNPTRSGRTTA
jgi:hypothetical protein